MKEVTLVFDEYMEKRLERLKKVLKMKEDMIITGAFSYFYHTIKFGYLLRRYAVRVAKGEMTMDQAIEKLLPVAESVLRLGTAIGLVWRQKKMKPEVMPIAMSLLAGLSIRLMPEITRMFGEKKDEGAS